MARWSWPQKDLWTIWKKCGRCILQICRRRDIGLCGWRNFRYKKARAGDIKGFTGIDAPYEAPLKPELIIETDKNDIEACAQIVIEYLSKEGIISKTLV